MAEYIAKKDLQEYLMNGKITLPVNSDREIEWGDIPTVTKTDICREIIANVENEVIATQVDYKEALYRILEYLETGRWDYAILAEMEQE